MDSFERAPKQAVLLAMGGPAGPLLAAALRPDARPILCVSADDAVVDLGAGARPAAIVIDTAMKPRVTSKPAPWAGSIGVETALEVYHYASILLPQVHVIGLVPSTQAQDVERLVDAGMRVMEERAAREVAQQLLRRFRISFHGPGIEAEVSLRVANDLRLTPKLAEILVLLVKELPDEDIADAVGIKRSGVVARCRALGSKAGLAPRDLARAIRREVFGIASTSSEALVARFHRALERAAK